MNEYSVRWREHFGEQEPARTAADVSFLLRVLPLPEYGRVLDVPCGSGRHRRALAERGYDVTGVDADAAVSPTIVGDLRDLDGLSIDFDAVINMWASFGYFSDEENRHVLGSLARRVRAGGRVVLDLFNGDFFADRRGTRELASGVVEHSTVVGGRRRCELRYPDGGVDVFEWQLYTPDELTAVAKAFGLRPVVTEARADRPSMRLVYERIL